jgi:hypothetical protein
MTGLTVRIDVRIDVSVDVRVDTVAGSERRTRRSRLYAQRAPSQPQRPAAHVGSPSTPETS